MRKKKQPLAGTGSWTQNHCLQPPISPLITYVRTNCTNTTCSKPIPYGQSLANHWPLDPPSNKLIYSSPFINTGTGIVLSLVLFHKWLLTIEQLFIGKNTVLDSWGGQLKWKHRMLRGVVHATVCLFYIARFCKATTNIQRQWTSQIFKIADKGTYDKHSSWYAVHSKEGRF